MKRNFLSYEFVKRNIKIRIKRIKKNTTSKFKTKTNKKKIVIFRNTQKRENRKNYKNRKDHENRKDREKTIF